MITLWSLQAAEATMETHTLARYISESTLQDYSFVTEKASRIAACSMYLALRMKALGPWVSAERCSQSSYHVRCLPPCRQAHWFTTVGTQSQRCCLWSSAWTHYYRLHWDKHQLSEASILTSKCVGVWGGTQPPGPYARALLILFLFLSCMCILDHVSGPPFLYCYNNRVPKTEL